MTASLDEEDPYVAPNITLSAKDSDFGAVLQKFVDSIVNGDFENTLNVKVRGLWFVQVYCLCCVCVFVVCFEQVNDRFKAHTNCLCCA